MKAFLRTSKQGNPKHNDRDFDLTHEDNDGHIDINRQHLNIYWHCYQDTEPELSFYDAEMKYYKEHYQDTVNRTNEAAIKARHKERMTTVAKIYNSSKTHPDETILQIGNRNDNIDLDTFTLCVEEYIEELKQYSDHIHILDYAIHGDEESPHAHIRQVFDYEDKDGFLHISTRKALALEHFERPDPLQEENILNNNKVSFTKRMRMKWQDICERHGFEIEREPEIFSYHKEKDQYIEDQKQLEQEQALLKRQQILQQQLEDQERQLELLKQNTLREQDKLKKAQAQRKQLKKLMKDDIKEYQEKTSKKHVSHKLREHDLIKTEDEQTKSPT